MAGNDGFGLQIWSHLEFLASPDIATLD